MSRAERPEVGVEDTDIAVVGMAGRFPGARSVGEFWRNICAGVESIVEYGEEELIAAGVKPELLADPRYVRAGPRLDDVELFDARFFGFSPRDAAVMDPQHRLFLEATWEALESCGHPPERFQGSIGVFAGCGMNAYFTYNVLTNRELLESVGFFLLRHTGNDRDFLPTTVSYKLGLTGPSVAIQTACSTSLVAIHYAAQSLLNGECDMALAGGVTLQIPTCHGYVYRENEALSPDGHCRAFDHRAQGTVVGSGLGIVVLRRAEEAIRDGDLVHALIKGSAVNNDGASKVGYLAPSVEGQARVIAEALAVAGVSPDSVSYIDAHGTGTPIGDPIEVSALTQAYREETDRKGFCAITSTKPNIGHLDTAAGVASLIKVVQALEHRKLPPTINFEAPNPEIDFETSPFYVNTELSEWAESDTPRRAAVSSLGIGGTNAHVILQEAPPRAPSTSPRREFQVLPLSAKTSTALASSRENLARCLEEGGDVELADVAFTLQTGRSALEQRCVVVCRDRSDVVELLSLGDPKRCFSGRARKEDLSVVYLFPGGGAQYPNMGHGLYASEPVFRAGLDRCAEMFQQQLGWDVRAYLYPEASAEAAADERLRTPSGTIASVFSIEYALAKLWSSWGIEPAAMIGHSLGEYVAALLAGVMSLEDAIRIVALRGTLVEKIQGAGGAMLSVPLPEKATRDLLGRELDLAAVNGPSLCVVSGPVDEVGALGRRLEEQGVETRQLHVVAAGHSRMLDPVLDEFRAAIAAVELSAPRKPYVSNVTGTWVRAEDARDPDYWVRHFRHTVRFSDGLGEILKNSDRVLLEVGPGQTLGSLARQQSATPAAVLGSIRRRDERVADVRHVLESFGRLWVAGIDVDWSTLHEGERRLRVPVPTYPFERERYWIDPTETPAVSSAPSPIAKMGDFNEWFRRSSWVRSEASVSPPTSASPLVWLLFLDRAGLGKALTRRLREAGHEVVTVTEGDAFCRLSDGAYVLAPEDGEEGYDVLVKDLAERERLPDRIVHLWTVTTDEGSRPGSSFFHRNLESGFYSLFFLARALAGEEVDRPVRLVVVSNGMQSVHGEPLPHPEKALVLGPVRVVPAEMPGILCQSIDVDVPTHATGRRARGALRSSLDRIADALQRELGADLRDPVVAFRAGSRWRETFEPIPASELADGRASPLRERGVYLVTGGLGGIALEVGEWLAKNARARLVLIGRSGLPPRERWAEWIETHSSRDPTTRKIRKLERLEELGAEIMLGTADVANIEQLGDVISEARERFGAIHGLFHVAGVAQDDPIALKTSESIEHVFTPKVHGTRVLESLLRDDTLDFSVLFSSTSPILGPPGQVDYVAANAFLDAFARNKAEQPGTYTVAVDWGVWKGVGMGTELSRRFRGAESLEGDEHKLDLHPLLGERIRSGSDRVTHLAEYRVQDQWVLDEHRTASGRALLPGTGYIELIRAALRESGPRGSLELRDLSLVSPLTVPDQGSRQVRVTLERDGAGWRVEVGGRAAASAGSWELHAQGRAVAGPEGAPESRPLREIEERCVERIEDGDGGVVETKQGRKLRFGPRWKCLRRAAFGREEALAWLDLGEFASDLSNYAVHPALLDIATGFALPLIEGYEDSEAVYVPLSYRLVRIHAPLTPRVRSWVRGRADNRAEADVVAFDASITDESGRLLVEVEELSFRRIPDANALTAPGARVGAAGSRETRDEPSSSERLFLQTYEAGIEASEGTAALTRVLSARPSARVIVSSIDLDVWMERTRAARDSSTGAAARFERPSLTSDYEAPRDELEAALADIWGELLGVSAVGIHDDFFELGGHSLIAVRLFARIKKALGVEEPISVLFQAATVAELAQTLRARVGASGAGDAAVATVASPRQRYLVEMTPGDGRKPPLFLVAGMLGNVLNLRHLAVHLGGGWPVYAIQARGLYGDDEPHRRFEDMAQDYLEEVRSVQPEGPYYLGGFSGGGVTAFEMARQLTDDGEDVALLALLDSMPPVDHRLSVRDRLEMQLADLRRERLGYFGRWARDRLRWEWSRLRRRFATEQRELTPAEFRSEQIELAFREALDHYRTPRYPGNVVLFRPPPERRWVLSGGRIVNSDRYFVDTLNHWTPYVAGEVELHVISGNHDSMVLEPNVRILAQRLRSSLDDAHRNEPGEEQG